MTPRGMWRSMTALVMLVTAVSAGCSGAGGVHHANAEYPAWPAVDRFRSDDLTPIAMTADFGDWEKFKTLVTADEYRVAVEEFAATPVPKKWATLDRMAAKDKAVAAMQALIEAAKQKTPAKELESLWRSVGESLGEVTKVAR